MLVGTQLARYQLGYPCRCYGGGYPAKQISVVSTYTYNLGGYPASQILVMGTHIHIMLMGTQLARYQLGYPYTYNVGGYPGSQISVLGSHIDVMLVGTQLSRYQL